MTEATTHITVCICTYKRPGLLHLLLEKLKAQKTDNCYSYSIVVADNDNKESARPVINRFKEEKKVSIQYFVEPERNIALVRNKAVNNAHGDYLAFIDDDELPEDTWLLALLTAIKKHRADAVLAPVRPRFAHEPPQWVVKGNFFSRPEFPTGRVMKPGECRTGNVLINKQSMGCLDVPFNPRYGSGSEDVDFFTRFIACGKTVIWCNEAPVYELIPPERCKRRYQIRLALLRGGNSFKHKNYRWMGIVKAVIALPFYFFALPFLVISGEPLFMRYFIKSCDHFGRLMRALGITLVKERGI